MKVNDEYVNSRKTNHGVSISAFKEFFVKDNQVFSIKEVERFKGENAFELLKQFVFNNLIKNHNHNELLVMMSLIIDQKPVQHSGTFIRQETSDGKVSIKYYDPNENHFFERGDHRIDYHKIFSRFELILVHILKGRPVKN
jgi:hypothetical protein